jgi:type I restriction enzyme S subunit
MPQNIGDNRIIRDGIARITTEDAERLERYRVRTGDIVYSRRGDVERRALVRSEEDGWLCGTGCLRVRFGSSDVDSAFASFYLGDPRVRSWIVRHAQGATMPNLNTAILSALPFVVPPIEEQRAIAQTLSALDDKIELDRKLNETLEAIARAIFKSWFVDFDPVRAKAEGREPEGMDATTASLFPSGFQESELGRIPKGWSISSIGQKVYVIDCLHSKKPERLDRGKPFLQLSNIQDNGIVDMSDTYNISDEDYEKWISRIEASPGDCVITNVGRVGAVAQMPTDVRAALGRNMTGLRCKEDFPFATFLIELMMSGAMREEISFKTDSGTILDSLNVRSIPRLRFACPSSLLLRHFEDSCRPLRAKMEICCKQIRILAALRDTLLPRLISGKLRVPEAEAMLTAV